MTINLSKVVELFESFKNDTPWYMKMIVGFILGIIVTAGVGYAILTPSQPVAAAPVQTEEVVASQPTPTWTPVPTATSAPTRTPAPTPTPSPVYVIWSAQAEAVNMRDEPAGNVVAIVANGEVIELLNEVEESEGYTWVKVIYGGKEGWIANILIWEMEGSYRLLDATQDYYETPAGAYKGTLPKGTPYQLLATDEGWLEIELPDGERGWIEG